MGHARTKLNITYVNGSLIVAAVLGWFAESWAVFLIALVVLIVSGLTSGEIRPTAGRR
jgi:hypothetical protein